MSAGIRYRLATQSDVAAEHRIFSVSVGALYAGRRYEWVAPPLDGFALGRGHVLAHDGPRCWVAEVDGEVVAYTGALLRGETWFFASLFVDPAFQGRGIGRELLGLASAGAPPRRLTITDSIQPISNTLYGTFGMLPIAPLIRLEGTSDGTAPTELEPGEATEAGLAAVDVAAYGFDRSVDHPYWASRGRRHAWLRGGELVAWSYRWANGKVGPLAAVDEATAAEALRAELATAGPVSIEMPATSRALLGAGLAAGLRMSGPMGLLLASDPVPAPTALAISTYGLY